MSIVGAVVERKERPAYVTFHKVPVEDKAASQQAGRYVAKNVDYAHVTPPYSKDVFKIEVKKWFAQMEVELQNGRLPQQWLDDYKRAYQLWQQGQELPLRGTPIKGWGVISPAQQEELIRMHILTVEDLAAVNDEGIKRIGMGAVDLKNKANAWLAQLNDKGPLTQEMAAVKAENTVLKSSVESLQRQVEDLKRLIPQAQAATMPSDTGMSGIAASDILDDEPPAPKKGKRG